MAAHGGFVEVMDDRVTLLSDVVELADQIDAARAERALAAVKSAGNDDEGATVAARRARLRLDLVGS